LEKQGGIFQPLEKKLSNHWKKWRKFSNHWKVFSNHWKNRVLPAGQRIVQNPGAIIRWR
jgi:hypothetical protein